jgi:hypothetical protein
LAHRRPRGVDLPEDDVVMPCDQRGMIWGKNWTGGKRIVKPSIPWIVSYFSDPGSRLFKIQSNEAGEVKNNFSVLQ